MAELRYVDWDGLVYYDGKIKEYIQDKAEDYIKMGGIISFEELPDPSWQNLNYIYKITNSFTSNNRFEKPGYVYPSGTWVQCVNYKEDETWVYIIFNEEVIGETSEIDLSNYYTKTEVDTKISDAIDSLEIPDTSNFLTREEFEDLTSEFPTQSDLDILDASVSEVESLLDEKADKEGLVGLATEEFVLAKIDEITTPDVDFNNYYTKEEVDNKVPTKLSQLENDQNFVTDAVLENYATKNYVDDYFKDNIEIIIPDLSNYATKTDLQEVEAKIPSVDGLATEDFVRTEIAKAELNGGEVTEEELNNLLANYYNKSEVDALIPDTSKFITEIPQEYVTDEELEAKGYLTEHQDLSEYAKKSDIPAPELFVVDYNAPDFAAALEAYNKGKLLLLTNAAPDANGYAVMNYVREDLITFTKFLMSRSETYGSFNTYYLHSNNTWELAKEVKLNKVEAVADANNDIIGLTIGKNTYEFDNFATTEVVNQINKNIENIENTYVSTDVLEAKEYITTSEATTKIEQIVKEEVAEAVTPDAINYGDFEADING